MKAQDYKNKINNVLRNAPRKTTGLIAVAVAVIATSGAVLAYGPSRPTFTIEKPADHVTFNSITNNPNYGDERNFVLIKDATNTTPGGWQDEINVQDGKEYIVRMYVHNNAAANLNKVAENVRASVTVPTTTGTSVQINGAITSDNASPQRVWDDVVLKSDKKFNIAYVQGSAKYNNNINPSTGFKLADSIVTSAGAQLGYEKLDGKIPGCFQYSGIASFKVKVQGEKTPNFTVTKQVRVNGTQEWKKSVTAQAGQKVDYRIGYDNTGESQQNNVTVKDKLPKNVAYTAGTSMLKNATNPTGNGLKVSDNIISTNGLNIGNYTAKSNAFVMFSATLPTADKLESCGVNTLRNTATIETDNGAKSDTADVLIEKKCAPNECKPGIPNGDARCTPVTPASELPTTGPAEVIAGLIGIAAITIGVVYYFKSRRELQDVLHDAQSQPTITKSTDKK